MSDKIKYQDLAEENLFGPAIKSAQDLIKVLDALELKFKEILQESAKIAKDTPLEARFENLKKIENALNDGAKATKGLDDVEKERQKTLKVIAQLEERLAQATSEQAQQQAELRVQIEQQNRANKEAAKERLGLVDAYQ